MDKNGQKVMCTEIEICNKWGTSEVGDAIMQGTIFGINSLFLIPKFVELMNGCEAHFELEEQKEPIFDKCCGIPS